jgi:hypothetical protein
MNPKQDPNTPKYDTTSGLLTDYGKSLGMKEVNSAITPADLAPAKPMTLPEPKATQPANFNLPDTTTPLEAEKVKIKAQKSSQESEISSLLTSLGITQGKEAQYVTDAGGDKAEKDYNKYKADLLTEQETNRKAIEKLQKNNPQGLFGGALQQEVSRLERESLSKQADIAILGNAAKGDYDSALSIAKRKVESELAPIKAELEAKKFVYENNKDLFSKAELSTLDGLIKADERKIKTEEDNKTKGEEMIVNALAMKAPNSVVQQARDVLAKGGTKFEVAQALGSYFRDLDMELKTAQISKAWADAKKSDVTSGSLTEQQLKQIDTSPQGKKLVSLSGLYQKSQTYKNLVDSYGFKATGSQKALLDSAYADLKIAYKEAANLGALTGPDVGLIEEAIKPSSGALNYFNYKLSGGQGGVSGAIDSALGKARKEALQNYKQLTARNPGYANSDYVNQLITPFAKDYSTVNIDTLPVGEIIQTEDGLLLESLGDGNFSPL